MPRAILRVSIGLLALALLPFGRPAGAAKTTLMNAIGLVDYSRKPDFKVGTWVRYHVVGGSVLGAKDDYMMTVVIAGEERFWGEDCFWLETWTEPIAGAPMATATLMSYSVFGDSLPLARMQLYMRKSILEVREDGTPIQQVIRRPEATIRRRDPIGKDINWSTDTLAVDTVQVPLGTYTCVPVVTRQGTGITEERGDSTSYAESRENRTAYLSTAVPITHLVREDIENTYKRRVWQRGRSGEGLPMQTLEEARGVARLEAFGHGAEARLVPERYRRSIREQLAAQAPKPAPRAPAATRRR